MDFTIHREKLEQAVGILDEQGVDCWLTFVRETSETPDPAMKLIVGHDVTWQSAFVVTRSGRCLAIVGGPDGALVRQAGLYETVVTYDEGIAPVLRATLREIDPHQIAINYSLGDVAADGLTHGMYLQLVEALRHTPFRQRLVSAASIIGPLRSRKMPAELARMRRAIAITEELFAQVTAFLCPGRTEREVAEMLHAELRRLGLGTSWQADSCPAVNAGAASEPGHAGPTDLEMHPGDLIHLDFGVAYEGYRSDLQRMWYLRSEREPEPPESVRHAFRACVEAIEAARKVLHAGVAGWQVDAVAREHLMRGGYPEYKHALGHSVGLACHDGGPLIGPRWPRYGETPKQPIQPNSVYTLELGTATERGYIGLEDEVLVAADGAEFISLAQRELISVG
ncbi:MAG TPA: Xaa-Pro peptidase family protein [Ktedonobacterales bacterium]|nr:Xaa-Pro peptidase family protein [Ktedonobacterales bacterium]